MFASVILTVFGLAFFVRAKGSRSSYLGVLVLFTVLLGGTPYMIDPPPGHPFQRRQQAEAHRDEPDPDIPGNQLHPAGPRHTPSLHHRRGQTLN